jgi:DNA primase
MYALTSPMGEVIGFGGRILEAAEDQPKYKNSPETLLYKKGENLFGLHAAKHAIRKGGRALVVEGNFDVMTLHERGIDYAVAPQGTAITEAQVALLKRFAREVVLMLDADPAGRAATLKVIRLFVDADLKTRIAQLRAQDGKKVDPDDLARNDLPRLERMIETAVDAVEFFFDQAAATAEPTVPGKVKAITECGPILRAVRDPLARDLYVDRLAQLLKIDPNLIKKTLRAAPDAHPAPRRELNHDVSPVVTEEPVPAVVPREIARPYAKLLALLAQHATLIAHMAPTVVDTIADLHVRALVSAALARRAFVPQELLAGAAPEIRDAVAAAFLSDEFVTLPDGTNAQKLLSDIVSKFRLSSDRSTLEEERKAAIASKDFDRVRELTARILSTRMQGETSR